MTRFVRPASILVAAGLLASSVAAQPRSSATLRPASDADLAPEAASYARHFDVSQEEATRRLRLQARVGELDAWLTENAREVYGGLSIEHQPHHRVVVRFTDKLRGAERLASAPRQGLTAPLELATVRRSLPQLEALLETTRVRLERAGVAADLTLDVRSNRIEVETLDLGPAASALGAEATAPGSGLTVRQVSGLARLDNPIQGGRPITGCTTGWVVRSNSGELGVTTAGHCGNAVTYFDDFLALTFRQEQRGGSYDIQWHSAGCGVTFRNEFDSGQGIRTVTGSLYRSQQSVGAWVCKRGNVTGLTCGSISSKTYRPNTAGIPNAQNTFVRVNAGDVPISLGGDSGAPWFSGNTAYGSHSGRNDDSTFAFYMAVDYLAGVGVSVLHFNPADNPPSATVSCTGTWAGSGNVSCTAFGFAGVSPYTVTGWSYFGSSPASSWSWSGGSANAYFNSGCPAGSYHSFTVTVVDSCGRVGYGQSSFICQPY